MCNNFYPTEGGCATISAPPGVFFCAIILAPQRGDVQPFMLLGEFFLCNNFYPTEEGCATISAPRGGGCYNFNVKILMCYYFYPTEGVCATISAPQGGGSAFSVQKFLPHKVPCQGGLCNYVCANISTLLPGRGSAFFSRFREGYKLLLDFTSVPSFICLVSWFVFIFWRT